MFQAPNSPEHPAHGQDRPTQPWGPSSRDSILQLCTSCPWKAASITAMEPACHQHALPGSPVHTALRACRDRDGLGPALPSLAINKGLGARLSGVHACRNESSFPDGERIEGHCYYSRLTAAQLHRAGRVRDGNAAAPPPHPTAAEKVPIWKRGKNSFQLNVPGAPNETN